MRNNILITFFTWLLCLIYGCENARDKNKSQIDAQNQLLKPLDDSMRFWLIKASDTFVNQKLDSVKQVALKNQDSLLLQYYHLWQFGQIVYTENLTEIVQNLKQVDKYVNDDSFSTPINIIAEKNYFKSTFYVTSNNKDSCMKYSISALDLAKELNDSFITVLTIYNLTKIYNQGNDTTQLGRYTRMATIYAKNQFLESYLGVINSVYFGTLVKDNKINIDTITYFLNKYVIPNYPNFTPRNRIRLYQNEATFLAINKNFAKADSIYNLVENYYITNNRNKDSVNFNSIGYFYRGRMIWAYYKNDENLVLKYGNIAAEYYGKCNNLTQQDYVYNSIYQFFKAKNNTKIALHFLEISDSITRMNTNNAISLKTRTLDNYYQNKIKDQQINQLKVYNQVETQRSQSRLYIIILVILLTAISIISFTFLYRRKIYHQEIREIELEQQLLRTQMEPHFIFNSLAILQSQIRLDQKEKAIKYLNNFAKLLRRSLENSRQSWVPLKNEINVLESYVAMQSTRFEGLFEYEFKLYEGYEQDSIFIPPMMIQPFIENSVNYAFKGIDYLGKLKIIVQKREDYIECQIIDNGVGLVKQPQNLEKKSLSTQIIQESLYVIGRKMNVRSGIMVNENFGGPGVNVLLYIPFKSTLNK